MQELKTLNEYEVMILKQDHFGNGIVKIKDMFVFIHGALPNDVCKIEITNIKKNFANAKIKEIVKSSNSRVIPKCPYYDICGGCHIMHQNYQNQLEFKEQKVKELLEKFTNLKDVNIFPIISQQQFYYRNKIILHGNGKKLGFYKEKTHSVVPIEECIITDKKINEIYKQIQNYLNENNDATITHVMFRTTTLNEIMIVLEGNIDENVIMSYLKEVNTIYYNTKLIKGNPYILEDIFGIKFQIYPTSFFQVNYETMLTMYRMVMNYYKDKNYHKVLDLYCGTGTIGMLVSPYIEHVVGVELEKSSIESALKCKELNKISNIDFIQGKVEDNIDSFTDIDSIIVDPPRSGLDRHTIDTLLEIKPKSISYISCDPVTLARDLKLLINEYDVLEVHPVDMFPNTYHVENVVFLERKNIIFDNYEVLVNKKYQYCKNDYSGMILVKTKDIEGNEILVEEVTYNNYLKFKDELKQLGIDVTITSAYRSEEEQQKTIDELKKIYQDENKLYQKVSPVGLSEHHTGLAIDITVSNQKQYQERLTNYYNQEELEIRENKYKIMASICSKYGFILRYPKDKIEITGYSYEPWHFRYVGSKAAKIIMENNITLEEYLDKK